MIKAIFGLAHQTSETEQFVNSETSNCFHNQTPISEAANNRIMQTPRESTNQSKMAEVLMSLPPLGLKLHKAPSFMDLIETKLYPQEIKPNTSTDIYPKKASNADIFLLRIGSWQRVAQNKEELVAKCYFAKRKLMWEILEKGLKRKIQMPWETILAIRADIRENQPGILEIELSQPPSFFQETEPQPKKHTLWDNASDFTGGQAMISRRHFLQFPPGGLDKLYAKLIKHEPRFLEMSLRPFPSLQSPYFDSDMFGLGSDISFGFNGNGLQVHSVQDSPSFPIAFNHVVDSQISFDFQQIPYSDTEMSLRPIQVRPNQDYHTLSNQSSFTSDFSPTSVMDLSQPIDELSSGESVSNMARWGRSVNDYADIEERYVIEDHFYQNYNRERFDNEEQALNNPHFLGNEGRFLGYSGVEAEEMNSANNEYESVVSENSDCNFYHQPNSWIQAQGKFEYNDFGPNQTMTQYFGIENSVGPWM